MDCLFSENKAGMLLKTKDRWRKEVKKKAKTKLNLRPETIGKAGYWALRGTLRDRNRWHTSEEAKQPCPASGCALPRRPLAGAQAVLPAVVDEPHAAGNDDDPMSVSN